MLLSKKLTGSDEELQELMFKNPSANKKKRDKEYFKNKKMMVVNNIEENKLKRK